MKISFTIIVFCTLLRVDIAKEICPKVCICDVFEGFKRADCSEQNLISPDVNLAKSVEILNLSGNQIATIDDENFEEFVDLINLSLAKNSIHTIELFAFASLTKLAYLDISENRLESIDNRMIENNLKLTVLDLSKNKFMMNIDDAPIVISTSLEFLSLRGSQLTFIYDSFFSEVPNLLDLDISNNLLITLKSATFFAIDKLQFINLEYNSFTCDTQMDKTIQFLKQRKVFIKIDKCLNIKKPKMFEKMIMLPTYEDEDDESKEDIEIELVWGKETNSGNLSDDLNLQHTSGMLRDYYIELRNNLEDESYCKNDEFASILCECRQNYIMHYEMTNRTHVILRRNVEMRISAVFYVGCLVGALSGCLVFYCMLIVKKKCRKASQKQVERQHMRERIVQEFNDQESIRETPVVPTPQLPPSIVRNRPPLPLPLPTRSSQQPYNPQSPLLQREMRSEFSPTANLLHKLFRNRDVQHHQQPASSSFYVPTPPPRTNRSRPRENLEMTQTIDILPEIPDAIDRIEAEVPNTVDDNDSDSEYVSINESIILEPDRSSTPPPAYREIYE